MRKTCKYPLSFVIVLLLAGSTAAGAASKAEFLAKYEPAAIPLKLSQGMIAVDFLAGH
jgi:hypothetical protein